MDKDIFKTRDFQLIKEILAKTNVVDIAEMLEEAPENEIVKIFRMLPKDKAVDVFAYLSSDMQRLIMVAITDHEISGIVDDLFLDDAVDFIEEMPANIVKRVLASVPSEKRDIINHFLKYPEDSAGSIMTIEFVELKESNSVSQAFDQIRKTGVDKETIYTCYVIDNQRKLQGTVSVKTMLLSSQEDLIGDIMDKNVISATTSDDQESLTNNFRKYGLLAMPVVDNENRLVGIVTVDDVLEVQEEEATEDFEIMAAMSPSEDPYLKTKVLSLAKNRIVWLLLLMLSAALTGSIINSFEKSLAALPALIAFIPMLMDTGGNAGSQSSTLIIRGMAIGEISPKNVLQILWKEFCVSVICGAVLVIFNFIRVLLSGQTVAIAITVSLALYATVIMAKTIGCLLPIAAKKFGFDPAVMASPVITTIVDAAALFAYFGLAKAILSI